MMERLLAKLERKIGRFAIPNLSYIVFGGMGFVFLMSFVRPEFLQFLALDWPHVMRGQAWRLISFIFLPPPPDMFFGPIGQMFGIYIYWMIGTNLESHWGSFKLNVFYLIGILGTIAAAMITQQPITNTFLNTSLFLAFATMF